MTTFSNTEKRELKITTGSGIIFTNFEVFGNVAKPGVKHGLLRLIYLPNETKTEEKRRNNI